MKPKKPLSSWKLDENNRHMGRNLNEIEKEDTRWRDPNEVWSNKSKLRKRSDLDLESGHLK